MKKTILITTCVFSLNSSTNIAECQLINYEYTQNDRTQQSDWNGTYCYRSCTQLWYCEDNKNTGGIDIKTIEKRENPKKILRTIHGVSYVCNKFLTTDDDIKTNSLNTQATKIETQKEGFKSIIIEIEELLFNFKRICGELKERLSFKNCMGN